MSEQLEQQVRFADQLAESYFTVLERLRRSGRKAIGGGAVYREDDFQLAIGEAASIVGSLIDAAEAAKATANAAGLEWARVEAEPFEAPTVDSSDHVLLQIGKAVRAREEIRGLQASLPHVDWSTGDGEVETDLFESRNRTAFAIGGAFVAAAVGFAFYNPPAAAAIGGIALLVLAKPVARALRWI